MKAKIVVTFNSPEEALAWAREHVKLNPVIEPQKPGLPALEDLIKPWVRETLNRAGITSTTALLSKNRRELQRIPGLGAVSMKSIDNSLAAAKLNLRGIRAGEL